MDWIIFTVVTDLNGLLQDSDSVSFVFLNYWTAVFQGLDALTTQKYKPQKRLPSAVR